MARLGMTTITSLFGIISIAMPIEQKHQQDELLKQTQI
jgi:hypothetical protein